MVRTYVIAVIAHADMVNEDAMDTTTPCATITAETPNEAWTTFYADYNTNDYSAYLTEAR